MGKDERWETVSDLIWFCVLNLVPSGIPTFSLRGMFESYVSLC